MTFSGDQPTNAKSAAPILAGRRVVADEWALVGIDDLEPAAWRALRSTSCSAVIAGPGAGKTEFLAQRAAFLLQTGQCPAPQRILAISFKRAAAANLRDRIRSRIPEHANRFVSMTFDAFTKTLVDRFRSTLPTQWELRGRYNIAFPNMIEQRDFLYNLATGAPSELQGGLFALSANNFVSEVVGLYDLPSPLHEPTNSAAEVAAFAWWKKRYLRPGPQDLDFVMINRLAELLVRTTPHISRGLKVTYPFVFIDEFQDTTFAQYSFLRSVFGHGAIVTAVGDRKQRIMGWAGALSDAFAEFRTDFQAEEFPLTWNFRSSPALVKLQHAVAVRLDPDVVAAVSKAETDIHDEPAHIWTFPNKDREATVVADWIAGDSARSGRRPAEYALVARQKVVEFEEVFRAALERHGIHLRNDDALVGKTRLQDLLTADIGRLLIGIVSLASAGGQPKVWLEVCNLVTTALGVDKSDDLSSRGPIDRLSDFIRELRGWFRSTSPSVDAVVEVKRRIIEFIGFENLRRELATHQLAEETQDIIDAFASRLAEVSQQSDTWESAAKRYESADAVPLMTIHRSKGLEYHTVFFLGLDGDQWWAHERDTVESTATFFVGLSRAAQRTIFTSCVQRGDRARIADLYEILQDSGVEEIEWD